MTELIENLIRDAANPTAVLMRIMQKYRYNGNNVILVVEGKDDSSFYERVASERDPDEGRDYYTIVAGNKSVALDAFGRLDWSRYDSCRILFFVDRDYSDFVPDEKSIEAGNVYVTDGYSIENGLINVNTAVALAKRACTQNTALTDRDEALIRDIYARAVDAASAVLMPVTACQITWKRQGVPFEAKGFRPEMFLRARNGEIKALYGIAQLYRSIVSCYGREYHSSDEKSYKSMLEEMKQGVSYELIVRGKYRMQVFELWFRSLKGYQLPSGAKLSPGRITQDIFAQAMAVVPAPKSLRDFIDVNLARSYVEIT